jgi:hypothetical protein
MPYTPRPSARFQGTPISASKGLAPYDPGDQFVSFGRTVPRQAATALGAAAMLAMVGLFGPGGSAKAEGLTITRQQARTPLFLQDFPLPEGASGTTVENITSRLAPFQAAGLNVTVIFADPAEVFEYPPGVIATDKGNTFPAFRQKETLAAYAAGILARNPAAARSDLTFVIARVPVVYAGMGYLGYDWTPLAAVSPSEKISRRLGHLDLQQFMRDFNKATYLTGPAGASINDTVERLAGIIPHIR